MEVGDSSNRKSPEIRLCLEDRGLGMLPSKGTPCAVRSPWDLGLLVSAARRDAYTLNMQGARAEGFHPASQIPEAGRNIRTEEQLNTTIFEAAVNKERETSCHKEVSQQVANNL